MICDFAVLAKKHFQERGVHGRLGLYTDRQDYVIVVRIACKDTAY